MPLISAWPLLAALAQAPAAPPPGAMHIVVRSEFLYLGSNRTSENEFWASGDKLWRKRGGQIAVAARRSASARPAPAADDLHTAGFDYTPEYTWKVTDTSETRTIHGRSCRLTTATGTAAYAQTELRLWLCPARGTDESALSELVADTAGGQYHSVAAFAAAEAQRRPGTVLLAYEETTEAPIAPVMVRKAEAITLDSAPAKD